jgi:hypothetical protein
MKTSLQTLTRLLLVSGLAGTLARAQVAAPPEPVSSETTTELLQSTPAVPGRTVVRELPSYRTQGTPAGYAEQRIVANLAQASALQPAPGSNFYSEDAKVFFEDANARPRALIIRSGESDEKTVSALEEDLNVMSRILTKSLKEKDLEDDTATAMGMHIRALTIGGQGAAQNIYLEGYGALFLFNVRFPLLAPPKTAEEKGSKEPVNTTWEEAKQELYGSKETLLRLKNNLAFKREEFDAKKVANLKEALLHALKNATHIRNVKSEEFITIAVIGTDIPSARRTVRATSVGSGEQNKNVFLQPSRIVGLMSTSSLGNGETTLTIRVKKADVDAFAKGSLDFEKFKEKVAVSTY